MQAPTNVLIALARLHAAAEELQHQLETERDEAQLEYSRLAMIPGGFTNEKVWAQIQQADDRLYHANRALRNAFGGFAGSIFVPQPENLDYDPIRVIA